MRHRILVVEDDAASRVGIAAYLAVHGYEVDCAARADEAVTLLARPYAAVITDLQLTPAQNAEGLGVVVEARRRWPGTRILLLTGSDSEAMEERARWLGVDAFLRKPKALEALERTVRTLVEAAP